MQVNVMLLMTLMGTAKADVGDNDNHDDAG